MFLEAWDSLALTLTPEFCSVAYQVIVFPDHPRSRESFRIDTRVVKLVKLGEDSVRSRTFLSLRFMSYPSYLNTSGTPPSTKSLTAEDGGEKAIFDSSCHAVVLHIDASGGAPAPRLNLPRFRRVKEYHDKEHGRVSNPPWQAKDVQEGYERGPSQRALAWLTKCYYG
jgi:hypothetical protein